MKKVLDLNLHRKQKKKIFIKKLLKVFLIFSVFFVVVLVVWHFSLKRMIFNDSNSNFPILFSGDEVLDFEKTKKGFCVLTNSQFNLYGKDGKILKNFSSYGFKSQVQSCDEYVLIYENDSKNYSLLKENHTLFKGVLGNDVFLGKVFKNGNFAFVTKCNSCLCELLVFNKNNEQIFKWSCGEGLIVDFHIFDDCSGCVLTTIGVKDGVLNSFLFNINFSKKTEKFKKTFLKNIPLKIKKSGSLLILVCDSKVYFLDGKGSVLNSFEYGLNLIDFIITKSGYFVCCFSNTSSLQFSSKIVSFDRFGNKINQVDFKEKIKKLESCFNDIIYVTDSEIVKTNVNLKEFKKIKNIGNVEKIIYEKPYVYFVSMNKINRVLLN